MDESGSQRVVKVHFIALHSGSDKEGTREEINDSVVAPVKG